MRKIIFSIAILFSLTYSYAGSFIEAPTKTDTTIRWINMPIQARYYIYNNYEGCTITKYEIIEHANKKNRYSVKIRYNGSSYQFLFNERGDMIKMKSV